MLKSNPTFGATGGGLETLGALEEEKEGIKHTL